MAAERADAGLIDADGPRFCGATLTGGRSSRLGTDKASFDPFGKGSLLEIGLDALRGAGCTETAYVGGPIRSSTPIDVVHLTDLHPGEGPLGGIITALRWSPEDLIVVLACDMPFVDVAVVVELTAVAVADPEAGVVVARVGDRAQPLTAVWRRSKALGELERGFASGIRAPRLMLRELDCRFVDGLDPERLVDIDSLEDVERYARISERGRAGE
jgi:molybdopterin-guanine dinucleotide biosynthesis protein A